MPFCPKAKNSSTEANIDEGLQKRYSACMFIDSHCHLSYDDYGDDLEQVIQRALDVDIKTMLTICTKLDEARSIIKLAQSRKELYCSVGVHPHDAESTDENLADALKTLAKEDKVIALGETGLDFYYEHSPRQKQTQAFKDHIQVAKETGLPLVVHTRDAEEETIACLAAERSNIKGVIHCFSGTQDLADQSLDLGFYISISGIVTFKKADELRAIVKNVPLERLLLETDAPFLAPVPQRGKRNEPAFMVHTAQVVADIKGVPLEELAAITSKNFYTLFNVSPNISNH